MEVKLDKRYPVAASIDQAWAVLSDVRATAACMPGAQITEQVDDTHYKGTVKSKIGPATMNFGGEIEVQGLDAAGRRLALHAKGADKSGSAASMALEAFLEPGDTPQACTLVGQATVTVSGKLAQFGSRLLVPVSDALLAQFAQAFSTAAQAVPGAVPAAAAATAEAPAGATTASAAATPPAAPPAALPAAPRELNALALMWTVFKSWLAGLFRRKPA